MTTVRAAFAELPACPSWCELDPGHGYFDTETGTGRAFRAHVRRLQLPMPDAAVMLCQSETVAVHSISGLPHGTAEQGEPTIEVDLAFCTILDTAQTRALAETLTSAAALLDTGVTA
ncbi:hypothetical protein [Allobranchiibius huperziae]|uniref:Uncharacterized protein n=1 Tax=Allobranchiibius huperziae TaxID=1874116 RepID=A0A853DKK7_9MICO|nr:hypothetical protein [Allobranchiibius huperziae]NYJ76573.1 hypothetical protein [Allobranchiibius huperziae]